MLNIVNIIGYLDIRITKVQYKLAHIENFAGTASFKHYTFFVKNLNIRSEIKQLICCCI